ncbi:MAG: class III lanthionine synthetase LanKC, partial [Enterococcus sp.]
MDLQYERYLEPQCKFYKKITKKKSEEDFSLSYIPEYWERIENKSSYWTYCVNTIPLPVQGWKIHISSTLEQAQITLDIVSSLLIARNVQFKFVKNMSSLLMSNSKYADRGSSGKFLTIYPPTEPIFLKLLDDLREKLRELDKGPYILSDERYFDSNVYFRYGGFVELKNIQGEFCILDSSGSKILDLREPYYHVPSFVNVPKKIERMEKEIAAKCGGLGRLSDYDIHSALHYSNGGGVYKAIEKNTGETVVIKEGRPKAGLDGQKEDAFTRIHKEAEILTHLLEVDEVVTISSSFDSWENSYLVEEFVLGEQLNTWIAQHYPFVPKNTTDFITYRKKASQVLQNIVTGVTAVHKKGIGIGDLSPSNIIVSTDLTIKIIDLETSDLLDLPYKPGLQTRGFSTKEARTRKQADLFACLRIARYLFYPAAQVQDLEVKQEVYIDYFIKHHFGTDTFSKITAIENQVYTYFPKLAKEKRRALSAIENQYEHDLLNLVPTYVESLRAGIIKNSDPTKPQLINGDIRQFEYPDGKVNVLYGGYGVIMSLMRTGEISDTVHLWLAKNSHRETLDKIQDVGLFTGLAGIGSVLYESGKTEEAIETLDKIAVTKLTDISLSTGLSGIGLGILAIGSLEQNDELISRSKKIGDTLIDMFVHNVNTAIGKFTNKGLLDGWAGPAFYLIALYNYTKETIWLTWAEKFLIKELATCKTDGSNVLYVEDENKFLPYLLGGSVGIAFALFEITKITENKLFSHKLEEIEP